MSQPFERIAVLGLRRSLRPSSPDVLDAITRACTELAAKKIGALIVLPGREPLTRHLDGGVFLRGRVSTPLLLSLFDAHSPADASHAVSFSPDADNSV